MVAVKHMVAVVCVVVAAGCTERLPTPAPAAQPPGANQGCMLISRPVAPVLVQQRADGTRLERPVLRPACAAIGVGVVAWRDERGLHVDVDVRAPQGGLARIDHYDVLPNERIGAGCLAGIVLGHREALVQLAGGLAIVDEKNGARPFALPALLATEIVVGLRDGGGVVINDGSHRLRIVGADGGPDRRVIGPFHTVLGHIDGSTIVLVDGRRVEAGAPIRSAGGRGRTLVASVGDEILGFVDGRGVVRLPRNRPVWINDHAVLVERELRFVELGAHGERERVRAALDPDVDATGKPLWNRERVTWTYDYEIDAVLVTERVRDEACNITDNVVAFDADGQRRVVADAPGGRARLHSEKGDISWVEFELRYEPMAVGTVNGVAEGSVVVGDGTAEASGTNRP